MRDIYVTKPYMPPEEEFEVYVKKIFERGILTNEGPNVVKFESLMKEYLGCDYFSYVTNGTIALQLALKALDIEDGEIITTPFSYVATISSILWERCIPVFVDIEPNNFTIDANKIEAAITPNTKAIMPVHVFGYACNVEEIQEIANKYGLKVIYDAAHTFGSVYKGKSLATYGDVSILSFHATKLFHTIEGGACIVKDKKIAEKIELIKKFGHQGDNHLTLGINAKQDEFNAAMGLANYKHLPEIFTRRKAVCTMYDKRLGGIVMHPKEQPNLEYNYAYYPVVFNSEEELLIVFGALNKSNIFPRRYFYPSLNTLSYLKERYSCPISEAISKRTACLPLSHYISEDEVETICEIIEKTIFNLRVRKVA